MHCIYCGCELVGVVRPAHVIPEGMGGRLTSITTVCNACNRSFAGIEGIACERLAQHGACVGALRGDRAPITAIVEYEGSRYRARGSRMDALAKPPTERGRVWPMPALREDQIKVIVAALRSRDWPPEAMLDGRFRLELDANVPPIGETQTNPLEYSFRWCDRDTTRVMTKVAIELLARQHGGEMRRSELERARRFARYNEVDCYSCVDIETAGAGLPLVNAPYVHGIELWSAGMKLHYRMTLFTYLRFVGTLTDAWAGKSLRCSYSFNVQDPAATLVASEEGDGATLVNKSYGLGRTEFALALAQLEEFNLSTSERRRGRAPPPSFEDLYPDVVEAMKKKAKA